ncbi:MAG TPA: hypothetical protein VMU25_03235 [Candidatus Paceibacterota bacterium]|nr:hypothetical protein [Candidatus Paceibacterota bacterium]
MLKQLKFASACVLAISLVTLDTLPVMVRADDTTSSVDSTAATSSAATTSSTSSLSSLDQSSASSTSSTSNDDLLLTASSSDPNFLSGSSTVSEIISNVASSSSDGFLDQASSTATTTPDATAPSTTSDIPVSVGAAAETVTAATDTPTASTTIVTGNSLALADILNLLNTSFVNSSGSILFANFPDSASTIDLRNASAFNGLCDGSPCSNLQSLLVNLLNTATLQNTVSVVANSGENQIANTSSSAAISTGSAFAGLNLVNLANVAFLDSQYLIVTLNAFQDVNGDIVFPALSSFSGSGSSLGDGSSVTSTNQGTVANDVNAQADTGSNTISGTGTQTILSGDSQSKVNVFNELNSLLAGSGVSILLRIGGAWNGQIQNAPDWLQVATSSDSVFITGDAPGSGDPIQGLGALASSSADISNDAHVAALSGGNNISNASSSALITTGDAFAGANVVNIANQTIIGRNWLLAVINIFGNFNGNVDFGRPDVWVGDTVNAPQYVENGTSLAYSITVKNNGDADAHGVVLDEAFDSAHLTIATSSLPYTVQQNGDLAFSLGDLAAGQTVQVTYYATVQNTSPGTSITNHTKASEEESDNNLSDNSDSVTVITGTPPSGGGGSYVVSTANAQPEYGDPQLAIGRLAPQVNALIGTPFTEKLIVRNVSHATAHNVFVRDFLKNPDGRVVNEQDFSVGDIVPGKGVVITYTFDFALNATPGLYTLMTDVSGDNIPETSSQNGSVFLQAMHFVAPTGTTFVTPMPYYRHAGHYQHTL